VRPHPKHFPPAASSPFDAFATAAHFPPDAYPVRAPAEHDREDFYVLFHIKLFAIMEMSVPRVTVAQ